MTIKSCGAPLSSLGTVTKNGVDVSDVAYACDPEAGWVQIVDPGPPLVIRRQEGTVVFTFKKPKPE